MGLRVLARLRKTQRRTTKGMTGSGAMVEMLSRMRRWMCMRSQKVSQVRTNWVPLTDQVSLKAQKQPVWQSDAPRVNSRPDERRNSKLDRTLILV